MSRDIKWAEWKTIDPEETMKMFFYLNEEDLVPRIEEDKTTTSYPEEKLPVHAVLDEGESASMNEKLLIRACVPQERDLQRQIKT